jgi:hypothetical protein
MDEKDQQIVFDLSEFVQKLTDRQLAFEKLTIEHQAQWERAMLARIEAHEAGLRDLLQMFKAQAITFAEAHERLEQLYATSESIKRLLATKRLDLPDVGGPLN